MCRIQISRRRVSICELSVESAGVCSAQHDENGRRFRNVKRRRPRTAGTRPKPVLITGLAVNHLGEILETLRRRSRQAMTDVTDTYSVGLSTTTWETLAIERPDLTM